MHAAPPVTELFLLAAVIIFAAPYLFWRLARADYYAPLVVVQIIAGIILGPGILGAMFPGYYTAVFTPPVIGALNGIAWWAVMLFVFVAGLELDLEEAWRWKGETGLTSGLALGVPLLFGSGAALLLLAKLVGSLENGELMLRALDLSSGVVTLRQADSPQELQISDSALINTFGPEYRMLLIGAGQLSEYLATMARVNGFAVTVCDPRPEYSGAWSVAGVTVTREMPDDVVQSFRPDQRSCVVALTHDPKLDDLALLEALNTSAFYVGAIGSRRNNLLRQQRMIEHFDQTEASLARLRGPIGIYIGSKTPAEIAVSIMAEVLAVKNGIPLPRDMDVAHAKNTHEGPPIDPSAPVCFTGR